MKSPEEWTNFYIISFLCILFSLNYINAQELKFKSISVENGLSQSTVNCMIEDRYGFLWFGTQDGLNRFDGYHFKIFRHDSKDLNSISDDNVWSMFEDNSGNIWIGTQDGILNCFNPVTEKFSHYLPDSSSTLSGNSITCIYQDTAGNLWLGTYKSGLFRFEFNSGYMKQYPHQPDNSNSLSNNFVTSIHQDSNGGLWVGTHNGLCLLNLEANPQKITRYYHDPNNANTLSHNTIWTFFQSKNDLEGFWIGTFNGLTYIETNQNKFIRVIPDQWNPDPFSRSISSICQDLSGRENKFWIGTYHGLLQINLDNFKFTRSVSSSDNPSGLTNNRINKVLIDRSGVLWIATQKGINYYSPQKDKFSFQSKDKYSETNSNVLNGLDIQAICETVDETIWFGTSTGLFALRQSENNYQVVKNNSFSNLNIWSLEAGNSDDLWIGSYGSGLKKMNLTSGKIQHWKGNLNDPRNIGNAYVRAIHQDKSGFLWIGLWGAGLNRLDTKTGIISKWNHQNDNPQSLSNNDVWVIFEDSFGRIWIGTYGGGLNLFDKTKGGIFYKWLHNSKNENGLNDNNILFIKESVFKNSKDKTILWIGTENGLNKFSVPNKSLTEHSLNEIEIKRFVFKEDFSANTINSIEEDDKGHLWITTNNGLIEFDPEKKILLNNYTTSDGLQSNEFNPNSVCKTKNGEIFIGSINGVNFFFPDSILHSKYIPNVIITDFQIFNQPVQIGQDSPLKMSINTVKEIVLSYSQNVFSFQFASLDYNAPDLNQYAYMMEGFDETWIFSGTRRFVTYTNLDPGKYTFRVKATNSDGIWNEKATQVAIIINPPFWATWWFRGFGFILIFGILYSFYRIKLKRILELERLRIKIASDLHDDIGAGLTRISLESELLKSNTNSEERNSAIQRIGTMSREIINSMSDVVWSIDSRNDSVENLINRMKDFSFSLFSLRNGRVIFETHNLDLQKKLKVDIRQNVYLILKEAINNSAKYSDSDHINVTMKNENGKFIMIVHDPGTTISHQKLSGHGLRNMQMRAEKIGGKIKFIKEDGFKVVFTGNEL